MSVQHTPGNGQHTLVRIEHTTPGDARVVVEYEDSDDEAGDQIATPGWCIRWALDRFHGGTDLYVALELAHALSSLELNDDDTRYLDDEAKKALAAMVDAAKELHEHQAEKRRKRKAERSSDGKR
jgi:hypothetical protein